MKKPSQAQDTFDQERTATQRSGRIASFFHRMLDRIHDVVVTIAPLTYSYESKRRMFGLPLLSIDLGPENPQGEMRHARGIIAIGTKATGVVAIGVFLARGCFTIAFLTIGLAGISIAGVGLLTISAFGLGIVSVSVIAVGYLAVGVLAIGYKSVGILAIGVEAVGIAAFGQVEDKLFPLRP